MYSNILVATDGSELGIKALQHALRLAKPGEAKITVVTVSDPSIIIAPGAEMMMIDAGPVLEELDRAKAENARHILDAARKEAGGLGFDIDIVHVADALTADGIIGTATSRNCDLIVMGSHGRRGLGRLLLGSQAAEVLARSTVPVLIVK